MGEVLYSVAKRSTGQLIKAVDAEKGEAYTCLVCSLPLILRKGIKKRPHFSHKVLSPGCNPETALHYGFKSLLCGKIQEHIERQLPLEIKWNCNYCGGTHTGNLLEKAIEVKLEHNLGACQPDIALLDLGGRTLAAIEVIVTHHIEQKTLDYYQQNRITVVSYVLKTDVDINRLANPILEPDRVDLCLNPKCSKCGKHMAKKCLLMTNVECWKCQSPIRVAAVRGDTGYGNTVHFLGAIPHPLCSQDDIQIATKVGAFIPLKYSRTAREKYFANACRNCKAFIGNHYLFRDYIADPSYTWEEFDAGYYCPFCYLTFHGKS